MRFAHLGFAGVGMACGFDFLDEVRRGICAEGHVSDRNYLGPDAAVEISINPR